MEQLRGFSHFEEVDKLTLYAGICEVLHKYFRIVQEYSSNMCNFELPGFSFTFEVTATDIFQTYNLTENVIISD